MARKILSQDTKKASEQRLPTLRSGKESVKAGRRQTQMEVDRLLARRRSQAYVDAMTSLDAGSHTVHAAGNDVLDTIREELPQLHPDEYPIGIVARCYLGEPFEVHTLEVGGGIVAHYKRMQPLPGMLERARALAKNGYYAFVEVYLTSIRAVKEDGMVVTVKE